MSKTETTLHPIFYEACGEKEGRYDLSQPYSWGGFVYATDGRILVRCSRIDFGTCDDSRKVPDPEKIVRELDGPRSPTPIPKCEQWKPCSTCDGSGLITSGDLTCEECGAIHPIRRDGKPLAYDCLDCSGRGSQRNHDPVRVTDSPNIYFQAHYLALLRRHGIESIDVALDSKLPARFAGKDFEGWLMPMDTERVERNMKS